MRAIALRCALILTAAVCFPPPAPAAGTLSIGVLAPEGEAEAARTWTPLAQALHGALADEQLVWRYVDLPALRAAVAAGELDFVVTNPGNYIELEVGHGVHRIATLDRFPAAAPGLAIASAIVVRAERADLATIRDLAGQRVMAVDPQAFGGYLLALQALRAAGIDPGRDLAELAFNGFPLQDIIAAVLDGRTDAGVVTTCTIERMIQRGELEAGRLRVLGATHDDGFPCLRSTRLFPDWPFAATRTTPHHVSKRVAMALLAIEAQRDRPGWTVPTDYQAVHDVYRELQVGPYAAAPPRLAELLWRYRVWFGAAAIVLATWLWHTVRVDQLVRRRTRQLSTALQAREAAERTAREQQDKLDHMGRLGILGELSSMLAHELNQPLAAIGNFARGMERRIEGGQLAPEPLLEASRAIADQAERAREVMVRIRGFSRKRPPERQPSMVSELLASALALYRSIGYGQTAVQWRAEPGLRVIVDRLQIEQVLLNLLQNAHEATQSLALTERQIVVRAGWEADAVQICVEDNGVGLDPAQFGRLFEPFFTTKREGLGLGLSLCKRIVESHGGRMWASPRGASQGMKFCLSLPGERTT